MRVLLIEDEPTTAKSIELMLSSEGFNVYTTDLGEEGLDLDESGPLGRDGAFSFIERGGPSACLLRRRNVWAT